MSTAQPDDLMFLKGCLEEALPEDYVRITFKDSSRSPIVITKIEEVAGKELSVLIDNDSISAFDVNKADWVDIVLADIDTAESVPIFQETFKLDAKFE